MKNDFDLEKIDKIDVKNFKVTPIHKLALAKYILLTVTILFLIGMLIFTFTKNEIIFDACKTILPPIATLIIGYYFSERPDD